MIRWHFSKRLRDFLADLPEVDRDKLVRSLGKFPRGVLPIENDPRWVIEFDSQSGLRQVSEHDVIVALKSDGLGLPEETTNNNKQSFLPDAMHENHQDKQQAGLTQKGCVLREIFGHSEALIAQKLCWLLSLDEPTSKKKSI